MFGLVASMSNKFHWSLIMTFQREHIVIRSLVHSDFNLEIVKTTSTELVDRDDLGERVWPLTLVLLVLSLALLSAHTSFSLLLLMTCAYCVI